MSQAHDSSSTAPHLPPLTFLPPNVGDPLPGSRGRRRMRPVPLVLATAAWGIIVVFVLLSLLERREVEQSPREVAVKDRLNLYLMRVQARTLLGHYQYAGGGGNGEAIFNEARKSMDNGPVDQRLRFIVIAGELRGPKEALDQISVLEQRLKTHQQQPGREQAQTLRVLRKLYSDYAKLRYDAPSVTSQEREELRHELGWFGELALAPAGQPEARDPITAAAGAAAAAPLHVECPDPTAREEVLVPARRTFLLTFVVAAAFFGFAFLGLVMLVGLLFLMGIRMVKGGLDCGTAPGGVYAETFALWTICFTGMLGVAAVVPLGSLRLMFSGLAMLLSLGVLLWPRLRGIPFRQIRHDIGWTLGRQPALEPVAGVASYVMGLPLLFVGVMLVAVATMIQHALFGGPNPDDFSSPENPSHPVAIYMARGSWGLRLQVFFLASVVAPIVEETMFRGVLYRHLRELTCGLHTVGSVLLSALVSSFVFAIIHPQGVLAVPALMALACGFVIAREWRGTLIPAMVAHGLNNALVLSITIALLGD